jgi:RNA polymerase sigma-70 factor (ECF subfamily)
MESGISKDLFNRLKQSDHAAFELIYKIYSKRLLFFVRSYVHNLDDAKDLIQNVFTKLWINRLSLNENTNLKAWLYIVSKNEALTFLEHLVIIDAKKLDYSSRLMRLQYNAIQKLEFSENDLTEILEITQRALISLSPNCRRVFEFSRFDEMRNQEIANKLDLSVKTVEAYITKALKVLRTALSDYLPVILIVLIFF